MQNITIGRYSDHEGIVHRDAAGDIEHIEKAYAGWIEGVRDDESTWIMYLDAAGSPQVFWPRREPEGAVIGDAVVLE